MTVAAAVVATACARLHGGSVRDCRCMLRNGGGWAECPPQARRVMPKLSPSIIVSMADTSPTALLPIPRLSGDICQTCGSPNMIRTGTCLTCVECGDSSGGCS